MAFTSNLVAGESIVDHKALFSNDGKLLLVPSGSSVVGFSTETGERIVEMHHHTDTVTGIALGGKNKLQLFSSSLDGRVVVSDYTDGGMLRAIDFEVPILQFGIRPGDQEPSVFAAVRREKEDKSLFKSSEVVIVALPGSVLRDRHSTPSPSSIIADASALLSVNQEPNDFVFSSNGEYLATYSAKKLLVYAIENEETFKYSCAFSITTIAFHPTKQCIAAGDTAGHIRLWYDFAQSNSPVVNKKLHWHAHAVGDLCFTSDGTYLLSGGEEAVLVLWQLDRDIKNYLPRLGSPIVKLACSPGDSRFSIGLQNNVIRLISGLNSSIERTLGSLRKTLPQQHKKNGVPVRTGLVSAPSSASVIALNGSPGHLQFFNIDKMCLSQELEVVGLNVVSRSDEESLTLTTIEHVAFSPQGVWLATIESWDNGELLAERKLKFWWFNSARQRYTLSTSVDAPHKDPITSLTFSPVLEPLSPQSNIPSAVAVTTSLDTSFKVWVSFTAEKEEEEDACGSATSWACRSVGYYHNLPCYESAFSEDGSLVVINFSKYLTVWDPFTCELREVFNTPGQSDRFTSVAFGHHRSSHYLMAGSHHHLHVWDLLTCSVTWSVPVSPNVLVSDPYSSAAVVFVPSSARLGSSDLYLFDPSSSAPMAVVKDACSSPVVRAVFMPSSSSEGSAVTSTTILSRLYFMNREQLLYTVSDEVETEKKSTIVKDNSTVSEQQHSLFNEIFTRRKINAIEQAIHKTSSQSSVRQVWKGFNAAPHVLPPMSLYCQKILTSFLPTSEDKRSSIKDDEIDSDDQDSDTEGMSVQAEDNSDNELVDCEEETPCDNVVEKAEKDVMEIDDQETSKRLREKVGKFDWLVGFFRTELLNDS